MKKLLVLQKKVVGAEFKLNRQAGVDLIIPTAEALDDWKKQSIELAYRLKNEKEGLKETDKPEKLAFQ